MKKYLALLTAALMLCAVPVAASDAASEETEGLKNDVVILYTSDVHCGIDQGFGYAGLAEAKDYYEEQGYHTVLVDDGDAIQGEPVGTVTKGEAIIDLMNQVGYDIAIPGNHEFDYGMENFLELTKKADFPYISCNFNKEGELIFDPYTIKEFDGVKIGFVGVTTPETLTTSTPRYFQDGNGNFIYGFLQDDTGEAVYKAVQDAVDSARAEGAEYIVVMGHLGNEDECKPWTYADVISNTTGIDIFLDGHSHDTDQVVMKNKDGEDVYRSACGTKLAGIGYAIISAADGSVSTGLHYWNNSVDACSLLHIKNDVLESVQAETEKLSELLDTPVAKSSFELTIYDPVEVSDDGKPIRMVRRAETNLGDLCADAYLDQSGADIAFVNGGGIRVSIPKGDITLGNILSVHPFGNSMTVIEVTGQQVLDALEWGSRVVPGENGGFIQVAGLTYEVDVAVEPSCTQDSDGMFTGVEGDYRVKNVMVGGEPLDLEKTYTLASHNYMLKEHGDGYTMFDGCNILQDEVKLDNQVLMDYITETLGGEIGEEYADPYGQGRITILDEES